MFNECFFDLRKYLISVAYLCLHDGMKFAHDRYMIQSLRNAIFLILAVVLMGALPLGRSWAQAPNTPQASSQITAQEREFSKELALILKLAQKHFKVSQISIGGGTARALLQRVFLNEPFVFRDFDLVFSADQQVTPESAKAFGQELEQKGLGKFSLENLRSRPRYNRYDKDAVVAKKHNAGFGFFVMSPTNTEYDISIFHSKQDLSLNGIMDVDRFQVVLTPEVSLADVVQDPELLLRQIVDPENALPRLLKNKIPRVANWWEVVKDPAMVAIRVVRTLAKFNGLPMDEVTKAKISKLVRQDIEGNPLQIARNFLKLLEDPFWLSEYKQLVEIGLFTHHFKSFEQALKRSNLSCADTLDEKVLAIFKEAKASDALQFLKLLAPLEPELITRILPQVITDKKLKVGYFTGEFAPFHKGHEGVVHSALQSKSVDLVFVIPTPLATNNPKSEVFDRAEWTERIEFARAGLQSSSQSWVWPLPMATDAKIQNLKDSIVALESFVDLKKPLTHIMGMDSFHRAVYRELLIKDPRPRIVVDRQGVPASAGIKNSLVQVIANIYPRPVSATRILHEVALDGSSPDIAPEVLTLIKKTPRYAEMLSHIVELEAELKTKIKPVKNYRDKTLIWYVLETHAGLYAPEYPKFEEKHQHILQELFDLNPKKILIAMEGNDLASKVAQRQWKNAARNFPNVEVVTDKIPPRDAQSIKVIHSGQINEILKQWRPTHTQSMIIFETADQPLSRIMKSVDGFVVIEPEGVAPTCGRIFK